MRFERHQPSGRLVVYQSGGYWYDLLQGAEYVMEEWLSDWRERYARSINNADCIIALAREGLLTPQDISTICLLAVDKGREKLATTMLELGANSKDAVSMGSRSLDHGYPVVKWIDDFARSDISGAQARILVYSGSNGSSSVLEALCVLQPR